MKNLLTLFITLVIGSYGFTQCPTPQLSYSTGDSCNFVFSIQYSDSSQMNYQFDMGDGTNYSGLTFGNTSISHSYTPANGTFNVTVYMWNAFCSDTLYQTITADCGTSQCNASLDVQWIDSCTYTFSLDSVSAGAQIFWDFGDGTYDNSGSNPVTHQYTTNGVVYPEVMYFDSVCSDTFTYQIYTSCDSTSSPSCNGYLDVISNDSCNYTFNLVNVSPGASTYWNMGDGTTYNNTNSVTHQYTSTGVVYPQVSYWDGVCSDTLYSQLYIDCDTIVIPSCNQTLTTQWIDSCTYMFSISNAAPGANISWDMGDGTTFSGSSSVTYQFNSSGFQFLNVSYNDGFCADTFNTNVYTYCDSTSGCNGYLDVISNDSCNYSFNLVNVSPGASVYWDMGDGTYYNNTNSVTHQYTSTGVVYPQVSYWDGVCSDSIYTQLYVDCDSITTPNCNQTLTTQWVDSCIYTFSITNASPGAQIYWDMGDGSTYNGVNSVTHQFNSSGVQYPTVYYYDGTCSDTFFTQVYTYCDSIPQPCNGYLDVQSVDSCNYTFSLVNVPAGASTYWDMGNGNMYNNTLSVNESYFGQGGAVVEVAYWDQNGCSDTLFYQFGFFCNDSIASTIENFEENFTIYPNPANEQLTVKGVESFVMINSFGSFILEAETEVINVSNLPNGVYIIRGLFKNGSYSTKRIVISH